jgi:hypothetical protein
LKRTHFRAHVFRADPDAPTSPPRRGKRSDREFIRNPEIDPRAALLRERMRVADHRLRYLPNVHSGTDRPTLRGRPPLKAFGPAEVSLWRIRYSRLRAGKPTCRGRLCMPSGAQRNISLWASVRKDNGRRAPPDAARPSGSAGESGAQCPERMRIPPGTRGNSGRRRPGTDEPFGARRERASTCRSRNAGIFGSQRESFGPALAEPAHPSGSTGETGQCLPGTAGSFGN